MVLDQYKPYLGVLRERYLYAVYPDRRYLPSKVRTFLDFMTSKLNARNKLTYWSLNPVEGGI